MKRALAVMVACATCATLAAVASSATTRSIKIGDNYFVRSSGVPVITVTRNTRVTWRWTGDSLHDVRVSSGPVKFKSKVQTSGTYSRTMRRAGTYTIVCRVHSGMKMRLRVTR